MCRWLTYLLIHTQFNRFPMTERLLQYIWQFQYFNKSELCTVQGEPLQVIHPGTLNTNQGPDFSAAKIKVGETTWAGNIELHLLASDWFRHAHQADANYKHIILHVVWKNDLPDCRPPLPHLPCVELQSRISRHLLQRYWELMNNVYFVPCEKNLSLVQELVWVNWKERLLVERLYRKSAHILQLFEQSNHHWEETFWWLIARNFGIRVNADAFEAVARTIPVSLLARHRNQIHTLEAILFGQAGLLEEKFEDDYPLLLQKEYRFFQTKYRLPKIFVAVHFLRMRPAAFPSIRLAQLAMLVQHSAQLFSRIREMHLLSDVKQLLNVTANDYWHYHYRFGEAGAFMQKKVGEVMVNNILINTVVPVLFAYGTYRDEQPYKDKALRWLEETGYEANSITRGWVACGIANRHAFDSQSLIELKTRYCDEKRCLDCMIGNALLKGNSLEL